MSKRPSLFAKATEPARRDEQQPESPVNENDAETRSKRPPSRAGKRILSVYIDPLAWKQLRLLALETNTTTQALGEEAINLLFAKHHINRSA